MKSRDFNNDLNQQKPPVKKAEKIKKDNPKVVKISEAHYDVIREKAFHERRTMREIIDEILDKHL